MIKKIKEFQAIILAVVFLGSFITGFIKFSELPSKITQLEKQINKLEKQIDNHNTRIQLNDKRIDQEKLNQGVEDIFKN